MARQDESLCKTKSKNLRNDRKKPKNFHFFIVFGKISNAIAHGNRSMERETWLITQTIGETKKKQRNKKQNYTDTKKAKFQNFSLFFCLLLVAFILSLLLTLISKEEKVETYGPVPSPCLCFIHNRHVQSTHSRSLALLCFSLVIVQTQRYTHTHVKKKGKKKKRQFLDGHGKIALHSSDNRKSVTGP